jgi:hypothetical protein
LKLRRLITAGAMLVAPFATIGTVEMVAPVAASAYPGTCPDGYGSVTTQYLQVDDSTLAGFDGYEHDWAPWQGNLGAGDAYEIVNLCVDVVHVAPGADTGYLFIYSPNMAAWLGGNSSESDEMTFTGSGPGANELLDFSCTNTSGGYEIRADALNDPIEFHSSYAGITNVEVATTAGAYDQMTDYTGGFCG